MLNYRFNKKLVPTAELIRELSIPISQLDFWKKYGSVLKTPGYQHAANRYNLYSPNTPMHVAGVEKHIKFDACTDDMLGTEIEICPTCGKPGYPGHGNAEIDMDMSKIDEVLQAAE